MIVRLHGLAVADLDQVVDFFADREEAEAALDAVLADESSWGQNAEARTCGTSIEHSGAQFLVG